MISRNKRNRGKKRLRRLLITFPFCVLCPSAFWCFVFCAQTKKCANRSRSTTNASSDFCHAKPNKCRVPCINLPSEACILPSLYCHFDAKAKATWKGSNLLKACYSVLCSEYSIAQFFYVFKCFGEFLLHFVTFLCQNRRPVVINAEESAECRVQSWLREFLK